MRKYRISWAFLGLSAFGLMNSTAIAQPATSEETAKEFANRTLAKIDELEKQLQDLTNIVERLDKELITQKAENQRLAKIIDENAAKYSKLNDEKTVIEPKVEPPKEEEKKPEPIVTPPLNPPVATPEPAMPVVDNAPPKQDTPLKPPIINPQPEPKLLSAEELLNAAKLGIQSSEYDKAKDSLKTLIEKHPTTKEGIEALWLDGELKFVAQDWLGAAQDYVAYLKAAPSGPRVSDVLIRLAGSYREMGDNRQRCLALNAYKERTPKPNAIQKARADDEFAKGACPKPANAK